MRLGRLLQGASVVCGLLLGGGLPAAVQGQLALTEFQASNLKTLKDEEGENVDWVEICNTGPASVDLAGWHLTDDAKELAKWQFPSTNLGPGEFLVVFASGKDKRVPGRPLHTSFKLGDTGEYLALVRPDGQTPVTAYAPKYPVQATDASYGLPLVAEEAPLLGPGMAGRLLVPRDGTLSTNWIVPDFDDSGWVRVTNGIGFDASGAGYLTAVADSVADWSVEGAQGARNWFYGYYNQTKDVTSGYQAGEFTPFPRSAEAYGVSNYWTGALYRWPAQSNPWDLIGQTDVHPNGVNNQEEHWVIRRWVSTTNGTLRARWKAMKTNPNGSGVTGQLYHNGTLKDTATMAGDDLVGVDRTLELANVREGDAIDLVLTPVGLGGATEDGSDGSANSLTLSKVSYLTKAIATDTGKAMKGINATAYARFPFEVDRLDELDRLKLRVRYNDGFLAYLNGHLAAARNAPVGSPGGIQADSVADWPPTGQQGFNNWYYGTYDRGADTDGRYDAFTDFDHTAAQWKWNGGAWVMGPSNPPWDMISAGGWQPNGDNSGGVHWVIRRWVCEAPGEADCHITFAKDNVTCGNGATLRVFQNGVQRLAWTLPFNDSVGLETNLFLPNLQAGDYLDFALDPTGTDGGASDACDSCSFAVTVEQSPSPGAVWNSVATATRSLEESAVAEEIDLSGMKDLLTAGTNVLVLQGLNASAADPTFLLVPELSGTYLRVDANQRVYFTQPTPGAANGPGATTLGPIVTEVGHLPQVPLDGEDLTVTARVTPTLRPVASVILKYRVMYAAELAVLMCDDGQHGDGSAGDGLFGAVIPATASKPGQMVRYFIAATDTGNQATRSPAFANPVGSPQYHGTVVFDPVLTNSRLPVLHWFIANPGAVDSDTGARGSIFFDGEFYDNVGANLHGQSTRDFPKKSYDIDFNPGEKFRWSKDAPRVDDVNLLTTWADKAHMRHVLAYETYRDAGAPSHFALPVRVQRNGAFFSVANLVENGDENQLARLGLDPRGAYYKMYNSADSTAGAEKKTRKQEGTADLQALITGMSQSSAAAREAYLYDHLNVPEVIDFLAAKIITSDTDCCHKNHYLYRDSEGTGEWQLMPWDVDLSFGRVWTCGSPCLAYFDETIYTNQYLFVGYGNTVLTPVYDTAATRQMFLRRLRTLMDTMLQPPGTPAASDFYRLKTQALRDRIAPDAALDLAAWGTWGNRETITQAVNRIWNEFLPGRRAYLFRNMSVTNRGEVPLPQPTNALVQFDALEYRPLSGNPLQEWLSLTNGNAYAVDISDWRLEGGVRFSFKAGTVIPAHSTLFVSPDVKAFRARTVSPKGGERRFVVGPYEGNLSAWGETLTLSDADGRAVSSRSFTGEPSNPQRFLRVTELFYHPDGFPNDAAWDEEQFEFLELRNTGPGPLALTGVRFTEGVFFDFSTAAITNLAAGARVVLARNTNAFVWRYGAGPPLAGQYAGSLDNAGERLRLQDGYGEKILDFSYNNQWYPITDGHGFSLAIVDDAAPWDAWGLRANWRPNGQRNGTPGQPDTQLPPVPPVVINELLAHTDPPQADALELYNPTDQAAQVGGWWLSDDFDTPRKFRLPAPTSIGPRGYVTFTEGWFNPTPGVPPSFGLGSEGDELWLFSADADGNLTGYVEGLEFGASANGIGFGRYTNSIGEVDYPAQAGLSLGKDNSGPLVGPVVLSEIMYHPPALQETNGLFSYLELANLAMTNAPLYEPTEPTNAWRLRGAVDFDFPPGLSLLPQGHLLVVGFDPATNSTALAAFRASYGISTLIPVVGPWQGKLENGEATIELRRPDLSGSNGVPYLLVEKVHYRDQAPWPASADGQGASLQRQTLAGYANEPTNWFAAPPTAGAANVPNRPPEVRLVSPTSGASFSNPTNVLLAAVAEDLDGEVERIEFHVDGRKLASVASLPYTFTWTNPPPGAHTVAAVAVDNRLGVTQSPTITISVISQPPTVRLLEPDPGTVRMAGTGLNLLASAEDPDGAIDRVTFLAGARVLGESFAPPYSLSWTPELPGVYSLTAVATDTSGSVSTSAVVQAAFAAGSRGDVTLVSTGSVWRYLDDGSNQGTAWRAPGFPDTSWKSGAAELGYGDQSDGRPETTLISFGPDAANKHITYYFRLAFNLTDAASIESLTVNLLRDDGAVVYLNDQAVFRSNLPDGADYLTTAEYAVSGAEESAFALQAVDAAHLREGTNLMAVEVHQAAAGSSDLGFELALTGVRTWLAPVIFAGPQGRTYRQGEAIDLAVEAGGSRPLRYQWQVEGKPIVGATNPVFTIPSATAAVAGTYRVAVSNSVGQAVSEPCALVLAGQQPQTGVDGMLGLRGEAIRVSVSTLLANDTNPDGAALVIKAVDATSRAGASVTLVGDQVSYVPLESFLGNDAFDYLVADPHGDSATGRVEVLVYDGALPRLHELTVTPTAGGYRLSYLGTPGRLCELHRTHTLTGWSLLQAAPLPAHGYLDYFEKEPPAEGAFYRVVEP